MVPGVVLDKPDKEEVCFYISSSYLCYGLIVFNIGDLEGSTGLQVIHKNHSEVFVSSCIMERGNFSTAAGLHLT